MSTSELFDTFEANPKDVRAFDALVRTLIAEADREGLTTLYEHLPEWVEDAATSPLLRVLMQKARTVEDVELADWLHFCNGIALWQRFDEHQRAESCFRKITGQAPEPERIREFYMGFYTAQKNWRRLEQFLTDAQRGPGEDPVEVKRTLGRLADEHGQPERAVTFWQSVHEVEPLDRDANEALARLYPKVGKWHSMVDLLREQLARVSDDDKEAHFALFDAIIRIYKEELGAPSKVVAAWQSVLEFDPGNRRALDALLAEYESMNRWPDAVRVMNQTIEATSDVAEKIVLHRRIATLMLNSFSNAAEAIVHLEAILSLDPSDLQASETLRETYEARHDWTRFSLVREREIERVEDQGARHAATIELASLATRSVRQPEIPIRLWRQVLEVDPEHPEALDALENLYERTKAWAELAPILERRATAGGEDVDAHLLERLAVLHEVRLEAPDRAEQWWRALLERDPAHRKAQSHIKTRLLERKAWDALEEFHRGAGTLEAWGRTLEGQAKSAEHADEEIKLLRRASQVWREEIVDLRRAMRCYDRVLELASDDVEILHEACDVYRGADAPKKLARCLEALILTVTEASVRQEALRELADVRGDVLQDHEGAFTTLSTLLDEVPHESELYGQLEAFARTSGRLPSWCEVVERHLEDVEGEEERLALLRRLGATYQNDLANDELAIDAYERVLLQTPDCAETLNALEHLRRVNQDWAGLAEVLERRIEATDDHVARRALRLELAEVLKVHLDRVRDAATLLETNLDEELSEEEATAVHDALVRLHVNAGDAEALAGALASRLELLATLPAPPARLADHEVCLGMLAYGTRRDRWRLKTTIGHYQAALEHVPGHRLALSRLEELLASEDYRRRVAEILEADAARRGADLRIAESLEVQVTCALEVDAKDDALQLLDRLVRLYRDDLQRWDEAWSTLMRLVSLDPSREEAITDLEALTDELGRWRHVAALYESLAQDADAAHDDTASHWRAMCARTWHYRLGETQTARRHYEAMAEIPDTSMEALEALEEIFRNGDYPEELLQVLERRLESDEDTHIRVERLLEIADLLQDRLRRIPGAVVHLQAARDLVPDSEIVHERLIALLSLTESWEELRDTLLAYMDQVRHDPGRLVVARDRLAAIYERRLGEMEASIALYGEILGENDEHAGAMAAMERIFEDPAHRALVAPILEPIYTRRGAWKHLIRVLEARAEDEPRPIDRIVWHERIANLYEEKGSDLHQAFGYRCRAFALDPTRSSSLDELHRLADALEAHEELMLLLIDHVERTVPLDRKIALHRHIAALARDRVGDLVLTEAHLEAVLGLTQADDGALDDLISVSRHTRDEGRLVELLMAKADVVTDPDALRTLLAEASELASKDDDTLERAIEITERLHELDPTAPEPLDALQRLYRRCGSWEALTDVVDKKLERAVLSGDRAQCAELGSLLAQLQGEKLGLHREAIETWRRVIDWNPGDRRALNSLDELYAEVQDWARLKEVLVLLQTDTDELHWVEYQFRVAELLRLEDRLDRPHEAIAAYAGLLDRRPDHAGAREALRQMIEGGQEPDAAFHVLEPVLAATGGVDLEMIWHLHEVMATHHEGDHDTQYEIYREMARLGLRELAAPARAYESWANAFEAVPARAEAREALASLADSLGRWDDLVATLIERAHRAGDLELERTLLIEAGDILEREVGDLEAAEAIYGRVVESHPDDLHALERLGSLYRRNGSMQAWVDTLARRCASETSLERRTELLLRHAHAAQEDLADLDLATASYLEVLDTAGPRAEAVEALWSIASGGHRIAEITPRLRPIFESEGTWDRLHAVMEMQLDIFDDVEERLALMDRLVDMNVDTLDRPEEALVWLGRAVHLAPHHVSRVDAAVTLATSLQCWGELNTILLKAALAAEHEERRIDLWLRAAEVARDLAGDGAEAERILRMVLEVDPADAQALVALDVLISQGGRWDELEVLLRRQLDVAVFDEERVEILLRLALLNRDELGRSENSRALFEEILELDEAHEPALRALELLTRDARDFVALCDVLSRLAESTADQNKRSMILAELAVLVERELRDDHRARALWRETLSLDPRHAQAPRELQRLAELHGDWEGVVSALEQEVRTGVADAERRLWIHKRAARIIRDELGDAFRAQTHWQAAREVAPRDRETLEALVDVHRDGANLEGLATILEAQVASGHYLDAEQTELWRELAVLYTTRLLDPARAITAWQEIIQADPHDEEAVSQLEHLYESEGRWHEAVHHYRDRMGLLEGTSKRSMWMRIAEIQRDRLGDHEGARITYAELLAAYPDHLEASEAMERLLRAAGHHDALAALLLDRVESLSKASERHVTLRALSTVYLEDLCQPENAFLVLQRAMLEEPTASATRAELERLAATTGMWGDLVDTYDTLLESLHDDERRDLVVSAARVMEEHLKRPELAMGYYARALQIDPDHEGVLREMIRLATELERWPDLIQLLERMLERTTDYRTELDLLRRLAAVQEREAKDIEGATGTWYRVLGNDPLDRHAIENLERLHGRAGQWTALIEILERRTQIEPGEAVNIALRIGDILRQELHQTDAAVERFEDVLSYEPGHDGALERLAAIHHSREDWGDLVMVYRRAYDATSDVNKRVSLAREVCLIQDEIFSDQDAVIMWCRRILELQPGEPETLALLERIYRDAQDWAALVEVLGLAVTHCDSNESAVGPLLRRARVLRDQLGLREEASAAYEAVLEHDPTRDEALQALEELYGIDGNWRGVLDVLERKVAIVQDDDTRVELLRRQGLIADEKMHDVDQSAKYYERALQRYPGHPGLVRSLTEIYERSGREKEAVQVLEDAIASAPDGATACDLHLRLATLWDVRLRHPDKTLLHLEAAVESQGNNPDALWRLAAIHLEERDWAAAMPLLDTLFHAARVAQDSGFREQIHKKLALCAAGLGDHERALEEYRQADEIVPHQPEVLYGMGVELFKLGEHPEAHRTLSALLEGASDQLDEETSIQIHLRLGECSTHMGDLADATRHLAHVVEARPDDLEALEAVIAVLEGAGEWARAVDYLERMAGSQSQPAERVHTWQRLGDIHRTHLGDDEAAIVSYERALTEGVFPTGPLSDLTEIYTKVGRFERALECVDRLLELEEDPQQESQLAIRGAGLCRDQLGAPRRALAYFERALDAEPSKLEAFESLDAILVGLEDWDAQAMAYERMIERIGETGDNTSAVRFTLHRNLGEIHRQRRHATQDALAHLERAAAIEPHDQGVRETLAALYESSEEHLERAAETHRALLALDPSRVESYHRLFSLWARLGEPQRAWCVAGLLVGMGEASPEESAAYESGRPSSMATVKPAGSEAWQDKLEGLDGDLSRVFHLLYESLRGDLGGAQAEELGLRKADRMAREDRTLILGMIERVALALDVPMPDVYIDRQREGIRVLPLMPPALGVSPSMMSGKSPRELIFHAARALYGLHPSRALASVYEPARLETLLMAAMERVCGQEVPALDPGLEASEVELIESQVSAVGEVLERTLSDSGREELGVLLKPYATGRTTPDVNRWILDAALARNHAALTCCGDVALALHLVRDDESAQLPIGRGDQLRSLVSFAVSEEHQLLRAQIHGASQPEVN